MSVHPSTEHINLIMMPNVQPGTKVGGIAGIGATKIPDFVTGDTGKDIQTVREFLKTEEGKALMAHCKKELAGQGVDVRKFDEMDMVAILQHEQQKQEGVKVGAIDTSWDFVKSNAKGAAPAEAAPTHAATPGTTKVGYNPLDPASVLDKRERDAGLKM